MRTRVAALAAGAALAAAARFAPPAAATSCYVAYDVRVATPAGEVAVSGWSDEGVDNGSRGRHTVTVTALGSPQYDSSVERLGGSPGIVERTTGVSYRRLLCP